MSFLRLNGVEIQVQDGSAEEQIVEIGERGRAFDGTYLSTRRAQKGMWRFRTRTLSQDQIMSIKQLLLGAGDNWSFNTDLFSGKGLGATPPATSEFVPSTGADGAAVQGQVKWGTGAVGFFANSENHASTKDTQGTSGSWTTTDTTASDNASNYYVGTGSVRLQMASAVNSIRAQARINLGSGAGGFTPTLAALSFYVKGINNKVIRARLRNVTQATEGTNVTLTLVPGVWVRLVDASDIVQSSGDVVELIVEENVVDDGPDFYIDALQVDTGQTTAYKNAGGAVGSDDATWPSPIQQDILGGATLSTWMRRLTPLGGSNESYMELSGGGQNMELIRPSGQTLRFATTGDGGSDNLDYTPGGDIFDGAWHHIAAVLNYVAPTGRYIKELFYDGSRVAQVDITSDKIPNLSLADALTCASNSDSYLDEMLVLPYPVAESFINGLYSATYESAPFPQLTADGDFTTRDRVTVEGEIGGVPFRQYADEDDGTWLNNAQSLNFTLHEV